MLLKFGNVAVVNTPIGLRSGEAITAAIAYLEASVDSKARR